MGRVRGNVLLSEDKTTWQCCKEWFKTATAHANRRKFRNTKNSKLGISLEYANSKSPERYDNLLLVAAMILFVLWCLGYASSQLGQARLLQANTEKKRNVLSFIYIGR